jgi:prevent-host-death family protein
MEAIMEINAAQFRANCLKLIDEVNLRQNEVIITKHGKPVAKLVGIKDKASVDPLIGTLAGAGKTCSDLTLPFDDEWDLEP